MLATAEALRELEPGIELTCVGTQAGLETTVVPEAGYELRLVDPVPLPREFSGALVTLPFRIAKAVSQAKAILRETAADAVVGFGGYASLPVVLAAWRMKIPCVVHEANAVPGLANRIAAQFAAVVCVTFANTGLPNQIVTGMPVHQEVAHLDRAEVRTQSRRSFGLDEDAKVLLVSGGSQGARRLNEAITGALEPLSDAGISVLHVTGKKNFEESVPDSPPPTYHRVPYVEHMETAYAAADLMLARSGAATVTEVALIGLPAIFVPLPHGNGEQAKNAAGVVEAGGGILIADCDLDKTRLVEEVVRLFDDESTLEAMSSAAKDVMPADSAQLVAQYTLNSARGSYAAD